MKNNTKNAKPKYKMLILRAYIALLSSWTTKHIVFVLGK